jgi:type I restriction enzyme S subunit
VKLDAPFLTLLMNSSAYRREIQTTATGTTVRHTSPNKLLAPHVPLIGLEEQVRIRLFLDKASLNVEQLHRDLNKLASLKTALMQDLLTGKRRVTQLFESRTREEAYA